VPRTAYGPVQPFGYRTGYPDWLDVPTPAAGATASVTVDGRWWLRVLAARLTITTDATVANRYISLDFIDGRGNTRLKNGASVLVTASTTAQAFEWQGNLNFANWAAGTPVFCPLAPWFLPPSWVVKFNVASIQATDAISGLSLWVEKFQTDDLDTLWRGGHH
jgi:hypothetical protein